MSGSADWEQASAKTKQLYSKCTPAAKRGRAKSEECRKTPSRKAFSYSLVYKVGGLTRTDQLRK